MIQLDNPVQIDRIQLGQTKSGRPQIEFFSGALEFPVLTLPEFAFNKMFDAGIDPNQLEPGKPLHTRFLAHWSEGEKVNGNGNPYRDVAALQSLAPADPTAQELQKIRLLLTYLAEQQPGGREALIHWYKERKK